MLRRLLALPIAVLIGLALAAVPAHAQTANGYQSQKKAIWGPVQVDGVSQFPIYKQLGVGIFQYGLNWSRIAPTQPADPRNPDDPAYQWPADLDLAVRDAAANNIRISVMLIRTPDWANADRASLASPTYERSTIPPKSPQQLADFAEAVAKRYPTIHLFMVEGEPIRYEQYYVTRTRFLETKPNAKQRQQIHGYASLVDAVYGRLKGISRSNLIIGGNTTTTGNISPVAWIKDLKLPNGKPPRMDLYGHNPFSTRTPDLSKPQQRSDSLDFSDLDTLEGLMKRYLQRNGRNRKLRIFISEYTAPTDAAGFEFPFHVTRAVQARWLKAAFRIAFRDPSIYTLGWIGLYDVPPRAEDGLGSNTGLIDLSGVRKPAFSVYQQARP